MSTRFWRLTLLLCAALLVLTPADAKRKKKSSRRRAVPQLSVPESRRLSLLFQEGVKQKLAGNMSAAYDIFRHCLDIYPQDADALFELSYLTFYIGEDSLATELCRRAVELDGQNPHYVEMLAAAYIARNDYAQAIPYMELLSKLRPRSLDVLHPLVNLYKSEGKTEEALTVLDRIELLEGRSLQTSLQKYALFLDKGDKEKAYQALADLEKESPYDLRISLTRGNCYLQNGDTDEALTCFEKVRLAQPENEELQVSMIDYYNSVEQKDRSAQLRDSLLYGKNTSQSLRRKLANQAMEEMWRDTVQRRRIRPMLDSLVRLSPTAEMYAVRTSFFMLTEAPMDTIAMSLRDLLQADPTNEQALSRLLVYYLGKQDMENVMDVCRMGINAQPDELVYYLYLSIAQSQLKQSVQAKETLQAGLRHVNENSKSEHVSDMYEILAELYHEEDRIADAYAAYDSCLVYNADNAAALNNYAYYLSLRGERIEEAEKMSYRAIKLEPLNKTYLDTYAWVLFAQERYVMAKFYIDRVVSPSATDSLLLADEDMHADVLEHAGDIYWHNGLEEKALRYWDLSRRKGSDNALLDKKLELKKYIKKDEDNETNEDK